MTFACSFAAALASFRLLNQDRAREQLNISDEKSRSSRRHVDSVDSVDSAGRTLDLTLFGLVRAVDVCLALLWARNRSRFSSKVAETIEHTAVPTMFATSSALVMWTWFYTPELLPPSYRTWISSAAQIDERLPQALRELRQGTFIYGKDTGREALLGDMSSELGMPREWGDPAKTVPIPCELYHSGTGKNCEYHALSRFWRGWRFAMAMYLPLNLGVLLLRRTATLQSVRQALKEASRSSAFLGAFVALFYYGVCLGRTRIGPRLMDEGTPTCQYLESGPNVATGCALCGWSILLEKAARRTEIAFFVAPRALATVLPRRYPRKVRRAFSSVGTRTNTKAGHLARTAGVRPVGSDAAHRRHTLTAPRARRLRARVADCTCLSLLRLASTGLCCSSRHRCCRPPSPLSSASKTSKERNRNPQRDPQRGLSQRGGAGKATPGGPLHHPAAAPPVEPCVRVKRSGVGGVVWLFEVDAALRCYAEPHACIPAWTGRGIADVTESLTDTMQMYPCIDQGVVCLCCMIRV